MQFQQVGNLHRISRTTGPTHHFLELELDESGSEPLEVEAMAHPSDIGKRPLEEREVVRFVLSGYLDAARSRDALPPIRRIRYVATDSPPESVYEDLARALVEHFFSPKEMSDSGRLESDAPSAEPARAVRKALEEFLSGKSPTARCPHCGCLVEFAAIGTDNQAWHHHCACSACSGTLRGL